MEMTFGKYFLVLIYILGFGLMCFVAGIEIRAGHTEMGWFFLVMGLPSIEGVFSVINGIETPDEKPKKDKKRV